MKNNELNDRRLQATPRGVGVMCGFYADKAENATLWDVEGNEVIDFAAGIAVLNTGHRHPKVIAAIENQLQSFTHTAWQIVPYESYIALAERINARVPIDGPAKTAFFSTGAEAVENAVKIARAYTKRPGLITDRAKWPRTSWALARSPARFTTRNIPTCCTASARKRH